MSATHPPQHAAAPVEGDAPRRQVQASSVVAPTAPRPGGLAPNPVAPSGGLATGPPPTIPPSGPPPTPAAPPQADDGPSIIDAALARPRVLLVGTAIGALLGIVWVLLNWSSYSMAARIALRDPWEADLAATDRPVGGDFERFVRSQVRFAGSDEVLADAATSLQLTVTEVRRHVSVTASPAGDVLVVTAQASDPAESERLVNGLIDAYARQRSLVVEQLAANALAGIDAELRGPNANNGELQNRASQLRIAVTSYGNGIAFVERDPITAALSPTMKVAFPLAGAIVGLGGAVFAAWVLADRRPRLDDPAATAARSGISYVGTMPAPGSIDPTDRRARVACDAVLLALANQLRGREPRHGGRAYCVVLAPTDDTVDVAGTAQLIAAAAIENGARAAVLDVTVAASSAASVDVRSQAQHALDRDLLLFACPAATLDVAALRLGLEADATLVVAAMGGAANALTDTLAAFDRAGLRPSGLLAVGPGAATTTGVPR